MELTNKERQKGRFEGMSRAIVAALASAVVATRASNSAKEGKGNGYLGKGEVR
jgi:hypothetical protein